MNNSLENNDLTQNNKKKVRLAVPIIALSVFIVFIFGATYAYYATSVTGQNSANFNVEMGAYNGAFIASCTPSEVSITMATDKMLNEAIGNYASNNTTCTVTYNTGVTGSTGSCKYDVVWTWSDTNYNTSKKMAGLTYTLEQNLSGGTTYTKLKDNLAFATATSANMILVSSQNITSTGSLVTHKYVFTERISNVNSDQTDMAGKTFKGKISIENVVC